MHFICRDSPYRVHFICRDCSYGVHFNSNSKVHALSGLYPSSFFFSILPTNYTGEQNKKKRCPEYFTWFRYIRDHRCLNEKPEVQKFKSVSGNLRIGPKTFCKNTEVRLEKNWGFAQTDFSAILCSQNHIFSKDKIFLILHQS